MSWFMPPKKVVHVSDKKTSHEIHRRKDGSRVVYTRSTVAHRRDSLLSSPPVSTLVNSHPTCSSSDPESIGPLDLSKADHVRDVIDAVQKLLYLTDATQVEIREITSSLQLRLFHTVTCTTEQMKSNSLCVYSLLSHADSLDPRSESKTLLDIAYKIINVISS